MSECKRGDCSLSAAAVSIMRERCFDGLGINCTFVDDDMNLLVALAQRAVLAGLDADANPDTQRRMREASERVREGHETALGFSIRASRDTQADPNGTALSQAKPDQNDGAPS